MKTTEAQLNDQCIVLNRQLHKTSDARLILYGAHLGKVMAIARGLEKPSSKFSSMLDCGHCVDAGLLEKNEHYLLVSCMQTEGFKDRYQSHKALLTSAYLCDLVDVTTENNDPQEEIYRLLLWTLKNLNDKNYKEMRLRFEWCYLVLLGFSDGSAAMLDEMFRAYFNTSVLLFWQQSMADEAKTLLVRDDISDKCLSNRCSHIFEQVIAREYRQQLQLKLRSQKILDEVVYESAVEGLDIAEK